MQDIIVSVNNSVVKVTTIEKNKLSTASKIVDATVVSGTQIANSIEFANVLGPLIALVTQQPKNRLALTFVIEPDDLLLKFITVNKRDGAVEDQLALETKSKVEDGNIDAYYFSSEKIAPFLYQLLGVKKAVMETYLEVAENLRMSLSAIVPWVLYLPKYVGVNDPAIFLTKIEGKNIITLSELNGVFFSGVYKQNELPADLHSIIRDLALYKRAQPIQRIYTLGYEDFTFDASYSTKNIEMPVMDGVSTKGFEVNVLAHYMLDQDGVLSNQFNLLNLLPVPVVQNKPTSILVYVGSIVGALVLVGGLAGGVFFSKNKAVQVPKSEVLSEATKVVEATPSVKPEDTMPKKELVAGDLKVRVENGAGVAGLAAKTKTMLTGLGYNVVSIDTATKNRDTTLLKFKKTKLEYKDLVVAGVNKSFPNAFIDDTLDPTAEYDLLVVVGTANNL